MAWEISAALSNSEPPFQLFSASSPNVNSWLQEVLTLPAGDELGFRRRYIHYISVRATNAPSTRQIALADNVASFCFLSRGGTPVTPHVTTRIYLHDAGGNDVMDRPIFSWINPFLTPARGGDTLTVLVPGDKNSTATQDYEINVAMGKELRG